MRVFDYFPFVYNSLPPDHLANDPKATANFTMGLFEKRERPLKVSRSTWTKCSEIRTTNFRMVWKLVFAKSSSRHFKTRTLVGHSRTLKNTLATFRDDTFFST